MISKPVVNITNLSKVYNGHRVLNQINLSIYPNDFFALLGPNGAGKSTIINLLTTLAKPTSGRITAFDKDIHQHPYQTKPYIGLVPQDFNFDRFEKCINILIYQAGYYGINRKLAEERAEYYLKRLDLWQQRHTRTEYLSGGMKRRLLIARGLIHQPKLLVLDEPTAGIDLAARHRIWDFIKEIHSHGTTIILTTHYLEEAEQLCQRIAILNQGNIIENTTMERLLSQLTKQTIILYLQKPAPVSMPQTMQAFHYQLVNATTLEVCIQSHQTLNQLFTVLSTHNIGVTGIKNKRNRLEQMFLARIHQNTPIEES